MEKKGDFIMIIHKDIDINAPLTDEERKMLDEMNKRPIQFDEDCPELTEEILQNLERVPTGRRHFDDRDAG